AATSGPRPVYAVAAVRGDDSRAPYAPGSHVPSYRAYLALAAAGFQQYATYRQAMVAAVVTNSVFGFLRFAVMLAVIEAGTRTVAGYDEAQLATFVWAGQGLIGVVLLWALPEFAERIRTGDVITDLLRPIDPVWFFPAAMAIGLIVATPFPSVIQIPLDILVERGSPTMQLGLLGVQGGWVVALLALCRWVQRRGERKLVIQGG